MDEVVDQELTELRQRVTRLERIVAMLLVSSQKLEETSWQKRAVEDVQDAARELIDDLTKINYFPRE